MKDTRRGLTLVELMIALSVMSILVAILMPALGKARRQARKVLGVHHQRRIVGSVSEFAWDHRDRYPESVATIGVGTWWNWQEPMMLTGYRARSPRLHRSLSTYLREYIKEAEVLYCPNSPEKYPYLQDAWDKADHWDHPQTLPQEDPLTGTYCFYWNYIGYLDGPRGPFVGPRSTAGGHRQSKVMVSDYFGFDHWRSPWSFGSCEHLPQAVITPGSWVSSAYWSLPSNGTASDRKTLDMEFHAGYIDGHVEAFSPSNVITMKIAITADGREPYPDGVGPGDFYLPANSLY